MHMHHDELRRTILNARRRVACDGVGPYPRATAELADMLDALEDQNAMLWAFVSDTPAVVEATATWRRCPNREVGLDHVVTDVEIRRGKTLGELMTTTDGRTFIRHLVERSSTYKPPLQAYIEVTLRQAVSAAARRHLLAVG